MAQYVKARMHYVELAPEFRLLCLAMRRGRSDGNAEALARAVVAAPDWAAVVEQARWHRVTSLVHAGLRASGLPDVPVDVLDELRRRAVEQARWSLAQIAEIKRLSRLFEQAAVRVLVLKGVALSVQLYGDPGMRGTGDLDLLVDPEQFWQAAAVLIEAGYRSPTGPLSTRKRATFRRWFHELTFFQTGIVGSVDLHHRLTQSRHLLPCDFGALWSEREEMRLGEVTIATLPKNKLALYLMVSSVRVLPVPKSPRRRRYCSSLKAS